MNDFTPLSALLGGVLIGLSASALLLTHGKVLGISGLYGGLFQASTPDRGFRLSFIAGLLASGLLVSFVYPRAFASPPAGRGLVVIAVAGLLVGYGTRLGDGCTSGHGVCGLSRLSRRSLVATLTFIAAGILSALVSARLFGGAA